LSSDTLVEVKNLSKYFPIGDDNFLSEKEYLKAVDNISFKVLKGKTTSLVGESGCGKSTAGRTILRLLDPTGGQVFFEEKDILSLKKKELTKLRREMQIIFQDPYASLNQRMRIRNIISEPIKYHKFLKGKEIDKRVDYLLDVVGLGERFGNRFPHELSGGQRQRVSIARALALNPKFIICDESVSALDVSIRSQVLNLLKDLQDEFGLTYLFISHDLSVIRHISDVVIVMYLGNIVEISPSEEFYSKPYHPYSIALLSATPISHPKMKKERIILNGDPPSPVNPPSGCVFHTRCFNVKPICKQQKPVLSPIGENKEHMVACFNPL
jgi:oligopeptide transport system ATP-binding protein